MKTPKLGLVWCPRRSIEATYLPIMRCPVYKRRDSNPGSRMELENRVGDDKGKGTSGDRMRLKVPMHRSGTHCLVVAVKRGSRAKGAGHPRRDGVNGQPEELLVLAEAGRLPRGGTSRMNREIHVRICGGLGVQIPGSTRRAYLPSHQTARVSILGGFSPGAAADDHVPCGSRLEQHFAKAAEKTPWIAERFIGISCCMRTTRSIKRLGFSQHYSEKNLIIEDSLNRPSSGRPGKPYRMSTAWKQSKPGSRTIRGIRSRISSGSQTRPRSAPGGSSSGSTSPPAPRFPTHPR